MIFPNISISSFKEVYSVGIFSNRRLEEVEEIYLSKKSRTSQLLTKVLLSLFFKRKVIYRDLQDLKDIEKKSVLLIGDDAIKFRNNFKYMYDLSELWYKETKLPFVFALWCVNKRFYKKNRKDIQNFYKILVDTKERFFEDIDKILKPVNRISKEYIHFYLKSLDYSLTQKHIKSLKLFSEYLLQLGIIKDKPEFRFIEV